MNGAGKTTTFNMMTGQHTITSGNIYLHAVSIKKKPDEYKKMFGYCPQNDALLLFMTAYELLKYMALIHGSNRSTLDEDLVALLVRTDLKKYANVRSQYYSGGTKRKLNMAVALQSNPVLLILDEPTTGVDPASRRYMWSLIQECQKNNREVILTSHR